MQLTELSEVGIRDDGVMEISRLKKDFDQLDRSFAAATAKYITYALVNDFGPQFRIYYLLQLTIKQPSFRVFWWIESSKEALIGECASVLGWILGAGSLVRPYLFVNAVLQTLQNAI